jgi:hypothetical protein
MTNALAYHAYDVCLFQPEDSIDDSREATPDSDSGYVVTNTDIIRRKIVDPQQQQPHSQQLQQQPHPQQMQQQQQLQQQHQQPQRGVKQLPTSPDPSSLSSTMTLAGNKPKNLFYGRN